MDQACTRPPEQRGTRPARTERGKCRGPSQAGPAEDTPPPHRISARRWGPTRQSQDQDIGLYGILLAVCMPPVGIVLVHCLQLVWNNTWPTDQSMNTCIRWNLYKHHVTHQHESVNLYTNTSIDVHLRTRSCMKHMHLGIDASTCTTP